MNRSLIETPEQLVFVLFITAGILEEKRQSQVFPSEGRSKEGVMFSKYNKLLSHQ